MKISEKLAQAKQEGTPTVSFEFFPAKTKAGVANLLHRIEEMYFRLRPTFVTLTWRSAFKDESLWLQIGSTIQKYGIDVLLHLTCHLPREDLRRVLANAREAGIQNILALRGDPPIGEDKWTPTAGGFCNAVELVRLIREEHGDYFCVAVAAYPEVHTEGWNSPHLPPSDQAASLDLLRLKEKVEAGADFIITQFFFDVENLVDWTRRCRDAGITIPILPGYLPIQNYRSFAKFTGWCKTAVPPAVTSTLQQIRDDDEAVKTYGIKLAVETCRRLLSEGFPYLHFYTMNLSTAVTNILTELELCPKQHERDMPWRGGQGRGQEAVRPIFWSNREASYLSRTAAWDEYPNGRWGDNRSPAFGDLTDYYLAFKRPKIDRRKIWGVPASEQDIFDVFARYVRGEIKQLPWCEQRLAAESDGISSDLELLNRHGFLTINSQPRVNAAPSSHPVYGWGGDGGYVFQKAYVEFFCPPASLARLRDALSLFPSLSFHAINKSGTEYTNAPARANAVTWGVFPGREILQPTVVDPDSFRIWKHEAFELWLRQWAVVYSTPPRKPKRTPAAAATATATAAAATASAAGAGETKAGEGEATAAAEAEAEAAAAAAAAAADSAAASLIASVAESYFLVNVVDNDYVRDSADIFALFRHVITESLTSEQLKGRVRQLEAGNRALNERCSRLSALQERSSSDIARLEGELATLRAENSALRRGAREAETSLILHTTTAKPAPAAAAQRSTTPTSSSAAAAAAGGGATAGKK